MTVKEINSLDSVLQQIKLILDGNGKIASAYLLGSAAAGRLRADSDIDIAVLLFDDSGFGFAERLALANALEDCVGRTVDIGTITERNLVYASEAILKGKRLIVKDENYVLASETRLLGCYLQYLDDRRVVEKAYCAA